MIEIWKAVGLNLQGGIHQGVESEAQQLPVEEPEKTKNKEEKAQQESNTSKVAKQKNLKKGGEEKPEDYVDPETPLGEKKRLSRQMAKQFNRSSVENSWYAWWEKSGYFVADSSSSKPPSVIVG
ncbi:hypothetical protein Vadar_003270 [Vaccinium darrowii]|uniref:Uncharacterized protein n=1 Tax=Vaccinium darrowii TaxID=229202 RepID=A0ACB7Z9A8_9ERIC|nr:hypothetical protein Vadar_003270 [Vaccinium darrowii]